MARVIIRVPPANHLVVLRAHTSIGRHPNNSVQILDQRVSKHHCVIEGNGAASFAVRDLGSVHGVWVNGVRVQGERALTHGDVIRLHQTELVFDDGSSPLARAFGIEPMLAKPPDARLLAMAAESPGIRCPACDALTAAVDPREQPLAAARYACPRCRLEWHTCARAAFRLGGWPLTCDRCGEVAVFEGADLWTAMAAARSSGWIEPAGPEVRTQWTCARCASPAEG